MRALVVVPTRNRSALARNAIGSIAAGADVGILVSDNSTDEAEIAALQQFCFAKRVSYLRPPTPMAMPAHWDWALGQALEQSATHISFLTDRMIFKPGEMKSLLAIAARYPDKIICYMHDRVADHETPVTLEQLPWTGNLFEVRTRTLLDLVANSVMYDCSTPRMLNCMVPRSIIEKIKAKFGTVFSSIAPDWNFGFRALATVDSVLFYERACLVHYASDQSNGESQNRGLFNSAHKDFIANLTQPLDHAAPLPQIHTVWNTIISEYMTVNDPGFPALDRTKYLHALAAGVAGIEDVTRRSEMTAMLQREGWQGELPPRSVQAGKTFQTTRDAIDYAINHPRKPQKNWPAASPPRPLRGSTAMFNPAALRRPGLLKWKLATALEKHLFVAQFRETLERHVLWRL